MVFILFVLGAALGSAIHAYVWRSHNNISFVRGRSYCDACGHALRFWELIPIASFFLCRRKCCYCKKPLRWSFLAVELFAGLIVPLLYLTSASAPTFMHHLVTFVLLFILFLCDLWYMEMPESVLELTMVWAIVALIFFTMGDVVHPLLTAAGIGGFFLVQYLVSSGRWIGSGDIFFGVAMGLLLGWPLGIAALVLAYVLGASIGGVLLATGRMRRGAHMPLGSFLTAATFLVHTLADWMPAVFDRISL